MTAGEQAWTGRWRSLLAEDGASVHRFNQGRAFQRSGRVTALRVEPGRLSGRVQGSRPTPYQVEALFGVLDEDAWETVTDVVAGQVRFAAGLLAGQVTGGLLDALDEAGVDLFGAPGEVDARCACGGAAEGCAHVVALWAQAADRFADDPFALFALRGRGRQRLLADLLARRRRGEQVPERMPAQTLPADGWTTARESLDDLALPHGDAGADPLRLLGDPPGWAGVSSAEDLFRPLVDRAVRRARALDSPGGSSG